MIHIIRNICRKKDVAISFLSPLATTESVMEDIERGICNILELYKINEYKLESPTDSGDAISNKYRLFNGLVRTYGQLAHYSDANVLKEALDGFVGQLIEYSIRDKVDPLIVQSVTELCYQILTSRVGMSSRSCLENIMIRTENLIPFLTYLEDEKRFDIESNYYHMCERAEYYGGGCMIDLEAIPLEGVQNKNIHLTVISIVHLIYFVCKNSQNPNSPLYKRCREYSTILNSHGREQILFNCLQIPDDDVKLAVVQSLDQVDIEEIEVDELTFFVRLLESYKNLGAGKTEEVLAVIFIILTKVVRDSGPSSREFIQKYAYNAIADSLDM